MSFVGKAYLDALSSIPRRASGWTGGAAALLALLLAIPSAGYAQTADDALRFSERSPAAGARMMGMAGAGIAGMADFSALYTNPAGLGYLQASQVVGSFNVMRAADEARFEAGANVARNTQNVGSFGLGSAGVAYKFPTRRGSLVLAGGVNQTGTFVRTLDYAGMNSENSITDTFLPFPGNYRLTGDGSLEFDFDTPFLAYNAGAIEFLQDAYENDVYPFIQAVDPETTIQQAEEVVEEGRVTEANFGGAMEAAQGVMIGASLNISFGTYRFTRLYQEIDVNNENAPAQYEVVLEDGTLSGFDQFDLDESIRSELVGASFRAGLSAEVAEGLYAGLTIETPTWYSVDETFGTRMTTFFDSGGSLSDGETDANEFDYTVRTPWRIGAGLSVQIGGVQVAGDLEYVDWTQLQLDADNADFSDANRRIRDFDAVINSRLGAEYHLGALMLRGGFAYQPDPRDIEIELPGGETTDRSKLFFSAGFSYAFDEQFRLDVGWMQERFDDQYRPYASDLIPGDRGPAPFVDEEVQRNRFLVGVTYAF